MNEITTKLISGNKVRKSRLHDEKGNFAGWKNIFLHALPALSSGLARLIFGYRPEKPWIAYSATERLKHHLTKTSRVLEFGSGMSTLWYAKHSGKVFSVEDDEHWYHRLSEIMKNKKFENVYYELALDSKDYWSFMAEDSSGFDLIMIDGSNRSKCLSSSLKLIRPGGIIYLDNSDQDSSLHGGDIRIADELMREFATKTGSTITEFIDFAPTQLFVQQGLMVIVPIYYRNV